MTSNPRSLKGRTVLVTGASGGIGSEIVRQARKEGATVYAAASTVHEKLLAVCEETGALPLGFSVQDEAEIANALSGLGITDVVNCAGWGGVISEPGDVDVEVLDKVMSVNLRGPVLVIKHASRDMLDRGVAGSIVNVSSQASLTYLYGHLGYGASKAALDYVTRTAAVELGTHGIRVNAVNPTVVMTDMATGHWGKPEFGGALLERMPLHQFATPLDVALPVIFLLSSAARMINGVCLPIDGGYTVA